MTGKILRISYLVAISALLASALLFFGVMYRDYEDGAFARLRAEAAAIAQGLGAVGSDYFDSFAPDGAGACFFRRQYPRNTGNRGDHSRRAHRF